ncbi:MAG: L-lysine 6-transaminase [Bacteroidota bacterium]
MEAPTVSRMTADQVWPTLEKHILADGMHMVLDMKESQGVRLIDRLTQRSYLDLFTFYASNPLGMNHPKLRSDAAFLERLMDAALNKVANSDIYTTHMARFVNTFSRVGIPEYLPHAFFISGGALAIENAMKIAFDWKVRQNFRKGYREEKGHQIMHFEQAFHGRSGYTMSVTNTVPMKTAYFPKFDWPRVVNPKANAPLTPGNIHCIEELETLAVAQMKRHFLERRDDIAAILIEPIQGEGGDNHFRPQFLQTLRDLADENDALLIFDEVQTGVGLTGTFWAHQGLGVEPDILAFGKKTQVCGCLAGRRVDEVENNVFELSSRINSTWGGNLVDMVRFDRILEIIEEDQLVDNAAQVGEHLISRLHDLADKYPDHVMNPRGQGLMCAFDLKTPELRDRVRHMAYEHGVIILGCGHAALRFRPSLAVTAADIDEGIDVLDRVIGQVTH